MQFAYVSLCDCWSTRGVGAGCRCLARFGIHPSATYGVDGRLRFHSDNPVRLTNGDAGHAQAYFFSAGNVTIGNLEVRRRAALSRVHSIRTQLNWTQLNCSWRTGPGTWASAHWGEWGQLTPWKNGWKIKKRKHTKKSSFLCLYYILRAFRAGRCRERRCADRIFIQIYFRMHRFVVKFSKFYSPQATRGIDHPQPKSCGRSCPVLRARQPCSQSSWWRRRTWPLANLMFETSIMVRDGVLCYS